MSKPAETQTEEESDARFRYLDDLLSAMIDGHNEARAVVAGGAPNVGTLEKYAKALETLRVGVANKRLHFGWVVPTEEDVAAARRLVQLVQDGAPAEALVEPAQAAARVMTDADNLEKLHAALLCLQDEAFRAQHHPRILEVLDLTTVVFERGCQAAGFVSTPDDVSAVRRLRQLAAADGPEALAECLRLAKELEARVPPYSTLNVMPREEIPGFLYLVR
jgi:hypothetical protein